MVSSRPRAQLATKSQAIRFESVCLAFGEVPVLNGVDLQVDDGEIVAIIGPSGCGKSTLLNLLAGLLRPSSGSIECLGKRVDGLNRHVSYVTQKDTLLPWRSAVDNVALPLEIAGVNKRERRKRASLELARLGVGAFASYRPHQLSGGMRSRLALGRALLSNAEIFLMDEPFAAIDALLRLKLQQLVIELWQATGKTILYVTHDLNEAITLAHRIVVLGHGKVLGTRSVPVPHPRDVARFRATPEAQALYVELWELLERELAR